MTEPLRLWSDEIDEMRAEARAAVQAGIGMFANLEVRSWELSREERVSQQRAAMPSVPAPEAVERLIAGVPCRAFLPPTRDDRGPRAVYLHFHGGGMVTGSPEMMDFPNRDLARDLGVVVVSSGYRKAPEHPYPAGPDDAFAVAAWLVEHAATEFGTDRIVIGGESAGGYLTALVALRLRDRLATAFDRVVGLNLVFGVYDWGRTPSQRGLRPHDGPDLLDPEGIEFITECYLPGQTEEERRAPDISPAYADLHGLPPMFMSVGTADHLVDDTLLLATRAAAAGNEVELFVAPDMPHAFFVFPCAMSKLWAERLNAWLEQVITGA
jgi:acetyl esterase/lipase